MLAGVPPVIGLYASILPLVVYALFGSSRTLSVGPVAVVSLLTATAASGVAAPGSPEYIAAPALALLSGLILVSIRLFGLGFVANLLSHPVISGFITASSLLIAAGQLRHVLGMMAEGATLVEMVPALLTQVPETHLPTPVIGSLATAFWAWLRSRLRPALIRLRLRLPAPAAALLACTGPVLVVAVSIAAVLLDLA